MKRGLAILFCIGLVGCSSKPYEATQNIYDKNITKNQEGLTHVRVHRAKQLSGSGLGESCPLVLKVDNSEVAGLQQNQFVDLYLTKGNHTISVRFKCALTEWKKSLEFVADGTYQEFETETGIAGQYRMWRIK